MNKDRIKYLLNKSKDTIKDEGVRSFIKKTNNFIKLRRKKAKFAAYKDVLFINGCYLPHPQRYRVDHQLEQLESYGYSVNKVGFEALTLDYLKYYRCFIFYRCPITPLIDEFINKAHYFNKKCFFDIDDLVIDTKYTDNIPYIKSMSKDEKKLYDDGVNRMQSTLKKCDYLITSTNALRDELLSYNKEVYVNRNVASEKMVELSLKALKELKKDDSKFIIGYLSGSITHNSDFELIKKPLIKILDEYPNTYLEVMGYLDLPDDLKKFKNRIITKEFADWKVLPKIIAELDINLAPLEESIFNEAKSENKWMEAALCKTVTIASNLGSFKDAIKDNETGLLCNNEKDWYEKIKYIIENKDIKEKIALNAHNYVLKKYVTTYTGLGLFKYIESKLVRNFVFVLPTTNVSGGVNVVMKHCNILRENGYDSMIVSMADNQDNLINKDGEINVISFNKAYLYARIDTMIATLWATLETVKSYHQAKNKKYLVQGFETDFGKFGQEMRLTANATYNSMDDIKYLTISKWCQKWLKEDYEKQACYAPNGIELDYFKFKKRNFKNKIKILVEGNSDDFYKNVDESFKITNKLDPDKFEIHYLSYQGKPKKWYKIAKSYNKVSYDEVHKIYDEADILIKSSILESFSYPPLEMMATGGVCVVVKNDGNSEYLKDRENCLFYEQGNIEDAIDKINELISNEKLRNDLIKNGRNTAESRDWKKIENDVLALYK